MRILITALLFVPLFVFGQNFDQSLEGAKMLMKDHPDSAKFILDTLISQASTNKNHEQLVRALIAKNELLSRTKKTNQQNAALTEEIVVLSTAHHYYELACEALINQGYYYRKQGNLPDALNSYQRALKIAEEYRLEKQIANSRNAIGVIHFYKGNYITALNFYEKALSSYIKINDSSSISKSYNNIAIIYSNQENYEEAVVYYEKSIEVLKKLKPLNYERLGKRLYNLFLAHMRVENYERAEATCKELISIDTENDIRNALESTGLLVEVLGKQGKLNEAIDLADSLFEAAATLGFEYETSMATIRKGWAYQDNEKYDAALKMYEKGKGVLGVSFEEDYEYYKNKAEVLLAIGSYKEAAESARLGIEVAKEFGYKAWISYLYELLYKSEFGFGDYEKAYHSLFNFHAYQDSLWDEEKAVELGRLQNQIELNQTRAENDKLITIANLKDSTISTQKAIILSISMLILLMSVFAFILRRQLRVRKELIRKIAAQSEQLKELDRTKSRFFTNISHDFRSPLSMIKGSMDAVTQIENDTLKDDSKMLLDMGKENCERLLYLAEEIMDLTRLEQNKIQLDLKKIDASLYFKSFVTIFTKEAERKEIDFVFRSGLTSTTLINLDAKQFDKVVYNLLSNAIKFTPKHGTIRVILNDKGEKLEAHFYNTTSKNLSQEKMDALFDRFHQDDNGINYSAGAGIGLSLAKELVDLHDGEIKVKGLNDGIEFIIHLPIVSEEQTVYDEQNV